MPLTSSESSNCDPFIEYKFNMMCVKLNMLKTFKETNVSKIREIRNQYSQKPYFLFALRYIGGKVRL